MNLGLKHTRSSTVNRIGSCPPLHACSAVPVVLSRAWCYQYISRGDTDVELEVAYSCNIFDVSDFLTCPDIQTS